MANRVDGGAEDQVFEAAMPVGAHDDEVGVNFACITDDLFGGRRRVRNGGFDGYSLAAQGLGDALQILLAGFGFRGRGLRAVDAAGDAFLHVQQENSAP